MKKKEKAMMLDYLVDQLSGDEAVEPKTRNTLVGDLNYIKVGDDGIVLLVDRKFTNNSFDALYNKVRRQKANVGAVVYKDGETFFRSAAQANYFKKSHSLSLKNYSSQDMQRMMLLRPEEVFLNSIADWVQYYQPHSSRLDECLASFKFDAVYFDYSHIDAYSQFKPSNRNSTKLFIWKARKKFTEPLELAKPCGRYGADYLRER